MSWAVARWHRAARLSTSVVRVICQQTRPAVLHLDEHVGCSRPYRARRKCGTEQGASAKPALLGPMSSVWAEILTYALEAELFSSNYVREGAPRAVFSPVNRMTCALAACPGPTVTSWRGLETHAHGYWRSTTCMGSEVSRLSTALGLFVGPPLILLTESVVVME